MIYVKINDILYPATIEGRTEDRNWDRRESKAITLEMDYATAVSLFVDDAAWSIVRQDDSFTDEETGEVVIPEAIEYDNSEFCIAGPITDNRDGTMTIKMGKYTLEELLLMEVLA